MTLLWVPAPGKGVWKLPCAAVPSGLLSQRSRPTTKGCWCLGNLCPYPHRNQHPYICTATPGQRAVVALIHLSTKYNGSTQRQEFVLVTEFSVSLSNCWCFMFVFARHIWSSCCLQKNLLSQHSVEEHLEKEGELKCNIWHWRRSFQRTLFTSAKTH